MADSKQYTQSALASACNLTVEILLREISSKNFESIYKVRDMCNTVHPAFNQSPYNCSIVAACFVVVVVVVVVVGYY